MHNFKELKIWIRSMALVTDVYKCTMSFPDSEKFGLTNQIRRSAVSVPSNIAEGCGRNSDKELVHFLGISNGSSFELETQLIIAKNLKFIEDDKSNTLLNELNEIQKMTRVFKASLVSKY